MTKREMWKLIEREIFGSDAGRGGSSVLFLLLVPIIATYWFWAPVVYQMAGEVFARIVFFFFFRGYHGT